MKAYKARAVLRYYLKEFYGGAYEHDIRYIFRYCFGIDNTFSDNEVDERLLNRVLEDIVRGLPIQYICGVEEFMGRPFLVFPDVFIPRQETETLVYVAAKKIPKHAKVMEIGTGTGVIGVSLLLLRKDIENFIGVEISAMATVNTFVNARRYGVIPRMDVMNISIFDAVDIFSSVSFVVSNPPYLPLSDRYSVDKTVSYEPEAALYGGPRGVEFIHKTIDVMQEVDFSGGFLFEFDDTTKGELMKHRAFSSYKVEYYKDDFGKERFALIWLL